MATLNIGEIAVAISANTASLNRAIPSIDKLEKAVNNLATSVDKMTTKMAGGFGKASKEAVKSNTETAKSTRDTSKQVEAAMIRQDKAMAGASERVKNLVQNLQGFKGSAPLINRAESALDSYNTELSSGALNSRQMANANISLQKELGEVRRTAKSANIPVGDFSHWMQDATKSVQLALGPLSGVASRITALTSLFNRNTLALAGFFAGITGITVATFKSVSAAKDYQRSLAQISGQLEVTGNAAGLTVDEIDNIAKSLAINTLASTQGARDAASALLSFTSVTGDSFARTLNIAQDMTAVLGGELTSNVEKLGRALEDPAEAFTLLNRSGIRFTETEKEMLRVMVATGEQGRAQELIFARLEGRFQGAAKAAAGGTLAGALDTLGESLTHLFETAATSSGLLDGLTEAVNRVSGQFIDMEKNVKGGSVVLSAYGKVVSSVANALGFLVQNIGAVTIGLSVGFLAVGLRPAIVGLTAFTARVKAAGIATVSFNTVLRSNPLIFLVTALGSAVAAYALFESAADDAAEAQGRAAESVQLTGKALREQSIQITKNRIEELSAEIDRLEQNSNKAAIGVGNFAGVSESVKLTNLRTALRNAQMSLEELQTQQKEDDSTDFVKGLKGKIEAMEALVKEYNNSSESVRKFNTDQKILASNLDASGKFALTASDYMSVFTKVTREEAQAAVDRLNRSLFGLNANMAAQSPYNAARRNLQEVTESLRQFYTLAGQESSLTIGASFTKELERVDINKRVADILSQVSGRETEFATQIGIVPEGRGATELIDAIRFKLSEIFTVYQEIEAIKPFSDELTEAQIQFEALNKTARDSGIGNFFSAGLLQKTVQFNAAVETTARNLRAAGIEEGSSEFATLRDQIESAARAGNVEIVPITNIETMAEGIEKVTAKVKTSQDSFKQWGSVLSGIFGQMNQIIATQLNALQNLAAYHRQQAEEALNYGRSQSEMWMQLADTVHYSNNQQAQAFEDRAIAAAEAAGQQYRAEKQAQERSNQLAKKAFERQKNLNIVQAIMSTATGITRALELGPIAGPIMASVIGALGAAQIGIIRSQEYTPRERGGPMTGGQPYLVGERGPELIIPNRGGNVVNNRDLSNMMGSGGGVTVNFNIQANDTKGFDKLLVERRGLIMNMIRQATDSQMRNAPV